MRVVDDASVSEVREEIRRQGGTLGLGSEAVESLAAAASELVHNQLAHARAGVVGLRSITRAGVPGLEVITADRGPGIAAPAAALRGEHAGGRGLGFGLSAACRLADEVDFDVRRGEGTCIWVRKFAAPPVLRSELAILGRPCEGEPVAGDHAVFRRDDDVLLAGVIDGLGHGPAAREASDRAVAALAGAAARDPLALIGACDRALEGTRGAVLAIARLELAAGQLSHAGAGNVASRIFQQGTRTSFLSAARVLGMRQPPVRIPLETVSLGSDAVLVMFTDGILSRADLTLELELLRQPPLVIAHEVLERFGRKNDDALVLVARRR